jgi:cytochrome c-type biogenesis protein CcmH
MKYVLLVVVAGAAVSLYAALGRAEVEYAAVQPATTNQTKVPSVTALLSGLESRVAENPNDGKDWLLLAKSYDHLGRHGDAIDAYEKAAALGVTDEQLLFRLMSKSAGWDTTQ